MKSFLLLVGLICLTGIDSSAQSSLTVGGAYLYGLQEEPLTIWDEEVTTYSASGYQLAVEYRYHFDESRFSIGAEGVLKGIYSEGQTSDKRFKNNTTKLLVGLGGQYRIYNRWTAGLGVQMENNRDLSLFRSESSDLFRYNLLLNNEVEVFDNIFVSLAYSRVITPKVNYYLLSSPFHQFFIGFKYRIL